MNSKGTRHGVQVQVLKIKQSCLMGGINLDKTCARASPQITHAIAYRCATLRCLLPADGTPAHREREKELERERL